MVQRSGGSNGAGETYVEVARRGGHTWWRYLLGLAVILFSWLVVGSVLSLVVILALGGFELDAGSPADVSSFLASFGPVGGYLVVNAAFPPFLIGVVLAVALIHGRHPRTLITARNRISWRRVGHGVLAWGIPWVLVIGLVQYLVYPATFSFGGNLSTLAYFVPLALFFTAIQITAEELFFRGYLVQGLSLISLNRIFLTLAAATLFTLPHLLNPEATAGGFLVVFLNYFVGSGLVWVVVSLLDGTTELAIGAHLANNLGNALLVNAVGTALVTPALFSVGEFHATFYALSVLVIAPVFFLLAFRFFGREDRLEKPDSIDDAAENE